VRWTKVACILFREARKVKRECGKTTEGIKEASERKSMELSKFKGSCVATFVTSIVLETLALRLSAVLCVSLRSYRCLPNRPLMRRKVTQSKVRDRDGSRWIADSSPDVKSFLHLTEER